MISNWRQNVFQHIVLCMFSAYRTLYFSDWQHNTIDPVVLWITIVMKKYELPWMQWVTINPSGAESSEYKCVFLFQIILPLTTLWLMIWRQIWVNGSGNCLLPRHYPKHCSLINEVYWHLVEGNFTHTIPNATHCKVYGNCIFESTVSSPMSSLETI